MFQGALRLLLAFGVVFYHLFPHTGIPGRQAVFGFYVISGFLIMRVMRSRYIDGLPGLGRFAINRFLRLYPAYLTALIVAVGGVLLYSSTAANLNPALRVPPSIVEWLPQFAIFGLLHLDGSVSNVRLIPPAWSLNMELLFYIMISVAFCRSRLPTTLIWAASAIAAVTLVLVGLHEVAYNTVVGTAFAFLTGSMMWLWHDEIRHALERAGLKEFGWLWLAGAFALTSAVIANQELISIASKVGFISVARMHSLALGDNAVLLYATVLVISPTLWITLKFAPPVSAKIRNFLELLGDLSYPVFLLHWPVAVLVFGMLGIHHGKPVWAAGLTVIVTLILSGFVVFGVEHQVEKLRAVVRKPGLVWKNLGLPVREGKLPKTEVL